MCLQNGEGVSIDFQGAAHYLKLAADQGIAVAQNNYGMCLLDGKGVWIDLQGAAHYLKRSHSRCRRGSKRGIEPPLICDPSDMAWLTPNSFLWTNTLWKTSVALNYAMLHTRQRCSSRATVPLSRR
jgi:hypothetical protein